MCPWKRRLSDDERSVLLSELLLRHPELVAEAEEITSTLLVVEDDQQLADEITARLRALRASGPVSVDTGRGQVLDVLQPYIDDLTRRKERGARRAAADIAIAVLSGLYECREDTHEDMLLVRMGLPGAADDLARIVYATVKPLRLSLPSLADECPEWEWYEEPRLRATTTMTSPDSPVSAAPVSGHSGWPVNRTPDDQPWLTQQPITGASFSRGSAAASCRISGVTAAGRTLRARAISFGDRPRARSGRGHVPAVHHRAFHHDPGYRHPGTPRSARPGALTGRLG